jgi:hypothetical protein
MTDSGSKERTRLRPGTTLQAGSIERRYRRSSVSLSLTSALWEHGRRVSRLNFGPGRHIAWPVGSVCPFWDPFRCLRVARAPLEPASAVVVDPVGSVWRNALVGPTAGDVLEEFIVPCGCFLKRFSPESPAEVDACKNTADVRSG